MRVPVLFTALAFLRNTWRGLTSMRTALVLLFLLALASLPGALLPQWSLSRRNVEEYFDKHPTLAPILDAVGAFNVFSSVWFASIYVLLFVSLVGCLVPRCLEYLRQLRAKPVRTPRNLGRMPHYERAVLDEGVDGVMAATRRRLRGWRLEERADSDGARTISAERGYTREAGNLVFHFALLGLLISVAGGGLISYEGQVIVMADGSTFCNSGTYNYDSFRAGPVVDGTDLSPFCVRVNDFDVEYLPTGQAKSFQADVDYQSGEALEKGVWKPHDLEVNNPLRTAGDRIYLTGNGYAPVFTVTFPGGETRTSAIQWQPVNTTTMLSQGATKFDPPGMTDEDRRQNNQLAITGLFAPTASLEGKLLSSRFPALKDPMVAVDVLRGQLGVATGRGQSIFSVDQSMIESGKLERVARQNLAVGETVRLDDRTTVRFDGVKRWVNLQVSHNPFQPYVLGCAVAVLFSLSASLTIKRRRVWVRAVPADRGGTDSDGTSPEPGDQAGRRTLVEVGGLARTDQAGYGEEFTRLAGDLLADGTGHTGSAETSEAAPARGRNG